MDEEQIEQDIKIEQMNKANIGDIIEEQEVESDDKKTKKAKIDPHFDVDAEEILDATIDPHLKET